MYYNGYIIRHNIIWESTNKLGSNAIGTIHTQMRKEWLATMPMVEKDIKSCVKGWTYKEQFDIDPQKIIEKKEVESNGWMSDGVKWEDEWMKACRIRGSGAVCPIDWERRVEDNLPGEMKGILNIGLITQTRVYVEWW